LAEELEPQVHAWDNWVMPIRRLHAEVDNLATAMRWSLAKDQPEIALRISGALREWFWTHPYGQQFHSWARAALESETSVAPQVRAKALNTVSMWAWGKGNADLGQELAGEAVRLARQADDHRVLLRALYELGRHVCGAGQYERAAELFEQSRDLSLECRHHIGVVEAATWLAFLQEPHKRRARLEGLLPQAPYMWQAYIHQSLGGTCYQLGDLAAAERHLAHAYQRWGEAEILATESIALYMLGLIAVLRGDDERAHSLLQQAMDLGRRCGQVVKVLMTTSILGRLAWRRSDLDTAERRWQEALVLAHERGNLYDILDVLRWLAYVACAQNDYDRAEQLARASLEGYAKHQESDRAEASMVLARVALFRGDAARAVELYRTSLAGVWSAEWTSALRALEGLGWALAEEGQHHRAARLLAAATRQRETSDARLPLIDQTRQRRVLAALRTALGEKAFAAVWAEGEGLTLEEAVRSAEP
jgi:tetratricopeptide (TPR) repeat protein